MADPGLDTSPEALLRAEPPVPSGPAARVYRTVNAELFTDLRAAGFRKIALQVPAGLTRNAHDLAAQIRRETGSDVVVVARACFGACDFPTPDEAPGAQASVVLGHARIPNVALPMPMYFVEMRETGGDPSALAALLDAAGLPHRLGLVASVQHLDLVPSLAEAIRATGREVRYDAGDHRLAYSAQALGCNYTGAERSATDSDAVIFLGTGQFHPLGLALAVDRPVYALDPLQGVLEPPLDRAALIRKRQLLVASVMDAQRWGILVSSFPGQHRGGMAQAMRARARSHGRNAEVFVFGRLDPSDLIGRDVEAYVSTACPRIALDDSASYPRPLLTPPEFLMALGELPLEPYRFDTYR
jgi:2-(3-amino-3-carboxypropyl)histidine synthase